MTPAELSTLRHIAAGIRHGLDDKAEGVIEFYADRLEDLLRREDVRGERRRGHDELCAFQISPLMACTCSARDPRESSADYGDAGEG